MNTSILKPDSFLTGHLQDYKVIKELGRGMTGEVYQIIGNQGNGRDFALKLFSPDYHLVAEKLDKLKDRFCTEAMGLLNLYHKNIIYVLDAGEEDLNGKIYSYYIMEFCEKSLKEFVFQEMDQVCQAIRDICSGLKYIHSKKIYHRDLKPSNIMLGKDGSFKISDFGFAKVDDELRKILDIPTGQSTELGFIIGDPDYIAPEVIRGDTSDQRTDVFMLGKMFNRDLKNIVFRFVDESKTKLEINKKETKLEFDNLINKMLEDDPNNRYQNIDEVEEVLHNIFIRIPEAFSERRERTADIFKSSLYSHVATTIKLPEQTNVAIPENWMKIIDCKEFQRLKKVRQLSTVIWVYPGADHCRFEHSLGVYYTAIQALKSLLRDDRVFSLLDERTIEIFLAASLLHDLGHYPFSHVIEEIIKFDPYKSNSSLNKYTHENMLKDFIDYEHSELRSTLRTLFTEDEMSIIRDLICLNYKDIRKIGKKWAFLKSLIDGLVDIDKIDYLEGDSVHCGVPYGKGFEKFRLTSSFTLNEEGDHLAISEKGRASLEILLLCRYTMFTEVYWHHTTRAIMAMLKRVFLELLGDDPDSVDIKVLEGYQDRTVTKSILGENIWSSNPYYYTDDESLWFLKSYSSSTGKTVADKLLNAIINGRYCKNTREEGLYKRIVTFPYIPEDSFNQRNSEVNEIVQKIMLRMYSRDWRDWSCNVIEKIKEKTNIRDLEEYHIIFDVAKKEERYKFQILYPKLNMFKNIRDASPIIKQLMSLFEKDANRHVRIFCHPKYYAKLTKHSKEIEEAIKNY